MTVLPEWFAVYLAIGVVLLAGTFVVNPDEWRSVLARYRLVEAIVAMAIVVLTWPLAFLRK